MDFIKNGLNGFQLKILALIFMTFDHIAYMFSDIIHVPAWFHIVGRLSAPLFIFMVAQGMWHTRNRLKYMMRLYLASVAMAMMNQVANLYFPMPNGGLIINNIFATMFLITFFIYVGENMVIAFKNKSFKKGLGFLFMLPVPFIISFILLFIISSQMFINLGHLTRPILSASMIFIPNPLLVEGGILWIILGIGFYLCKGSKKKTGIFYTLFCLIVFLLSNGMDFSFENLFLINVQWLMILSLPILMLYNDQKGKGLRSFFYIYYPAHIYILLGLSHLLYTFIN